MAPGTLVISFRGPGTDDLATTLVDWLPTMTPPGHVIADLTGLILVTLARSRLS